jgi:hypothetical protein
MDTFKTPWAPIFGNHETSGGHAQDPNSAVPPHSKPKLAELFSISKYCLFQYGPIGFEDGKSGGGGGAGNYAFNLTKNGQIIHSFIMMDTCQGTDWAHLYSSDRQIEWYQWMQRGLITTSSKKISNWSTTLCTHVPFDAYDDFSDTDTDKCRYLYGAKEDTVYSQTNSNVFYPKIIELGHVDQILCGHDHANDFSFIHKIDNIRLTYALKSRRNWNNDTQTNKDYDPSMLGFLGMTIDAKNNVYQANHLTSFI